MLEKSITFSKIKLFTPRLHKRTTQKHILSLPSSPTSLIFFTKYLQLKYTLHLNNHLQNNFTSKWNGKFTGKFKEILITYGWEGTQMRVCVWNLNDKQLMYSFRTEYIIQYISNGQIVQLPYPQYEGFVSVVGNPCTLSNPMGELVAWGYAGVVLCRMNIRTGKCCAKWVKARELLVILYNDYILLCKISNSLDHIEKIMGMDRACCELDIWCRPDLIFLDSTQVLQRYLTLDTINNTNTGENIRKIDYLGEFGNIISIRGDRKVIVNQKNNIFYFTVSNKHNNNSQAFHGFVEYNKTLNIYRNIRFPQDYQNIRAFSEFENEKIFFLSLARGVIIFVDIREIGKFSVIDLNNTQIELKQVNI